MVPSEDSNQRPVNCKSVALPIAPLCHILHIALPLISLKLLQLSYISWNTPFLMLILITSLTKTHIVVKMHDKADC